MEWRFSDNSKLSGPGLLSIRKIFRSLGDLQLRIVIIGKKGTRKVFYAAFSVVTMCDLSPPSGKALDTSFKFTCRGSAGPLPGLEIHHAIIANPVLGFYEVLYPKFTRSMILPDPLASERNWTVAFPGHSGCDLSTHCANNCCPVFNINVTRGGSRPAMELIITMEKLLADENTEVSHATTVQVWRWADRKAEGVDKYLRLAGS